MFQRDVNIDEFLKLTNAGLSVATFAQIRSALVERYKSIYGSDIDLSTGSADGVYVNDLSLIINNILQVVNTMYANLDANTASGIYLDSLCALANVFRKQATHSFAYVNVAYSGDSATTITQQDLIFLDQSGLEWQADSAYSFNPNETKSIKLVCEKDGPIQAPAGWITTPIDAGLNLTVEQQADAIVGSDVETDSELRYRRAQSSGANGITVADGLVGALLEVSGVRDAKLVINNTDSNVTAADGTTITRHGVYVILRLNDGITVDSATIGKLIYSKLTPGISTVQSSGSIAKSYNYVAEVNNIYASLMTQTVYWKEAVPIKPMVTILIKPYPFFSTSEFDQIAASLIKYLNGLHLDVKIDDNDLLAQTIYADPTFKGNATYAVLSAETTAHGSANSNGLTYYNYKTAFVNCDATLTSTTDPSSTKTFTDGVLTVMGTDYYLCLDCVISASGTTYPIVDGKITLWDDKEYTIARTFKKTGDNYEIILSIEEAG